MMDDETLLARFLDGDLDEAEIAAFEDRLEREPALAARLERWLANDGAVAQDIEAMLAAKPAPVPAPVMAVTATPIDLAAHRAAKAREAKPAARRWFVPASLAASLAAVGLLSLSVLRADDTSSLMALETLPAGQAIALADGGELTAVLTFAAADGRWCREFAISGQGSGIACREDGSWQAQGEMAEGTAATGDQTEGYATAAGADPAALDDLYASLGAGDPLGPDDEAGLMQNGWTGRPG